MKYEQAYDLLVRQERIYQRAHNYAQEILSRIAKDAEAIRSSKVFKFLINPMSELY